MSEFRKSVVQVNSAETRQQARERGFEELSERVCMEEDNAGSITLDLYEKDKVEEELVDELFVLDDFRI